MPLPTPTLVNQPGEEEAFRWRMWFSSSLIWLHFRKRSPSDTWEHHQTINNSVFTVINTPNSAALVLAVRQPAVVCLDFKGPYLSFLCTFSGSPSFKGVYCRATWSLFYLSTFVLCVVWLHLTLWPHHLEPPHVLDGAFRTSIQP